MEKECLVCGNKFAVHKNNPRKKYCSKKCGRKYHWDHNREHELNTMKSWYQKHKDSEIEKNKEYRKQNRELFNWYHNKKRFNGVKQNILFRDNFKCRACLSDNKIVVHHKDGTNYIRNKKLGENVNNDYSNLITLCQSCHARLHSYHRYNNLKLPTRDEDIVRSIRELIANKETRK